MDLTPNDAIRLYSHSPDTKRLAIFTAAGDIFMADLTALTNRVSEYEAGMAR
jgi:hypothetical protein